ncbi:sugar kinase [Plantactinospora siamensis]|uniref:Sugar kinase n=1 Tax=Plantactinospora siamensis TaxID=555372 RepID=A0ABV6P6W8_9ACTN
MPSPLPSVAAAPEVVTCGESMVVLCPPPPETLADAERVSVTVGGAESNLAMSLARLGHRTAWLSRVGADPFGRRVLRHVSAAGVDTALVTVDPDAPTGVYFKDPHAGGTRVHYYRAGSAASRLGPEALADPRLVGARVLHLSGITAALSGSCRALVADAVHRRPVAGALVSFDVNHRPALWPARRAAPVLRELADAADLVFVGRDEAETLWGTPDPAAVRRLLPRPELVVVKDGPIAATALPRSGAPATVPAPRVGVVEPVGAGDAFAAGYLSALLRGLGPVPALRLGHLVAAQALASAGDNAALPARGWFDDLVAAPATVWSPLDLTDPRYVAG